MKITNIKEVKKDLIKSIRINTKIFEIMKDQGESIQQFLDRHLNTMLKKYNRKK